MTREERAAVLEVARQPPDFVKPGAAVWYAASPGHRFKGFVASEPWQLGSGDWVVQLDGMEPAYGEYSGRVRTRVPCAATWCLELRGPPESTNG